MRSAPIDSCNSTRSWPPPISPAPRKEKSSRPNTRRWLSERANASSSSSRPAAKQPPTSAPIDEPATTSGTTPIAASSCSAPICAQPRAAPAPSAKPMRGRLLRRAAAARGEFGVGSAQIGRPPSLTPRRPAPARRSASRAVLIDPLSPVTRLQRRESAARSGARPYGASTMRQPGAAGGRFDPPIETGATAGVAGAAVAADADPRQQRVLVAIDPQLDHGLDLAGGVALAPQLAGATATNSA